MADDRELTHGDPGEIAAVEASVSRWSRAVEIIGQSISLALRTLGEALHSTPMLHICPPIPYFFQAVAQFLDGIRFLIRSRYETFASSPEDMPPKPLVVFACFIASACFILSVPMLFGILAPPAVGLVLATAGTGIVWAREGCKPFGFWAVMGIALFALNGFILSPVILPSLLGLSAIKCMGCLCMAPGIIDGTIEAVKKAYDYLKTRDRAPSHTIHRRVLSRARLSPSSQSPLFVCHSPKNNKNKNKNKNNNNNCHYHYPTLFSRSRKHVTVRHERPWDDKRILFNCEIKRERTHATI